VYGAAAEGEDLAAVSERHRIRLFLDSNVLVAGIVSPRGLDKAVLSMCAARLCQLMLAEVVRDEVEESLRFHATKRLESGAAVELIESYRKLIELMHPELVKHPLAARVRANRHLSRHEADVPVLLSAMESGPDWLLTHNRKHFTAAVAKRCGLRIATPTVFFRTLASLME
jgi:predicted nucleic acid-binding protein